MNIEHTEKYTFSAPEVWAKSISNEELLSKVKETDFTKQVQDEGKDICFYLNKTNRFSDNKNEEYSCVVYSLTQPRNLEMASVEDIYLEEFSTMHFHRISVIREGEIIDKFPDTKIKVFDSEEQSQGGVYSNSKKINISIKDLRLYDTIVIERTIENQYADKEHIRKEYMRHVFVTPDVYWGYSYYRAAVINNTRKNIAYQPFFFRDDKGNLLNSEKKILLPGETFAFEEQNYMNPVDANREIFPFIDFATDADWQSLSQFIYPLYQTVLAQTPNLEFAPELKQKIDEIPNKDQKIKWAIDYVQNHIKYIYDAAEMNGHQPQSADITYQTKQGDCKAKSVILKLLLDYIGVDAEIVLVNYRNDFYLKYYLPSLLAFNHVIVRIQQNGKDYFVDPTLQDEAGILENRGFLQFYHYMVVQPGQNLSYRTPHRFPKFCIDETVNYHVKDGKGEIELISKFRYHRANGMRNYFKNVNKREILDSWMNSLFYCLNFVNDRKIEDIRNIFTNPEIKISKDDKDENLVEIYFKAELENPYFTDKDKKRFLMFWDHNTLKSGVRDFNSKDFTYWHGFESEKYEINMSTDLEIDTKEKYTRQENKVENPYFTHEIRKKIHKNGASAYIEYHPLSNIEIPVAEIQKLKEDYEKITDSNFGLGIDIIESGGNSIFSKITSWFK
ncbi:MAG: DUF3857 domain-containing protein [Cruoricaptor ignavus]|nr:DUF3857 domain-containing protein [Cruoricaptor ignavus]